MPIFIYCFDFIYFIDVDVLSGFSCINRKFLPEVDLQYLGLEVPWPPFRPPSDHLPELGRPVKQKSQEGMTPTFCGSSTGL